MPNLFPLSGRLIVDFQWLGIYGLRRGGRYSVALPSVLAQHLKRHRNQISGQPTEI